ncbi:hypothetical protein JH262_21870 [Xanthomonas campestris pv. incanae]|nr:M35 family metallo-endopeptidase [Xanthomonas campestris]WDJ98098.1 hypothetical protein JH262_21870 [Xanthomonas campestris pv. incanae]
MHAWRVMAIVALIIWSHSASAAGRLNIKIEQAVKAINSDKPVSNKQDETGIRVIATNLGDQDIEVVDQWFPKTNKSGLLMNNVFRVLADDGSEAPYFGIYVNMDGAPEDVYVKVSPKQKKVVDVNIQLNYRLKPGRHYTVSLRSPSRYLNRPKLAYKNASRDSLRASWLEASSNEVRIFAGDQLKTELTSPKTSHHKTTEAEFASCSAAQVQHVGQNVIPQSTAIAYEALTEYGQQTKVQTFDVPPYVDMSFEPTARFTTWFGVHGDPDDYLPDDQYNDSMVFATWYRLTNDPMNPKPPVSITCQCDPVENNISPNALAWVTPGTLYQVNLCPRFFESPQFPTVYDEFSQVGTFLHEITHFSDEIVNGTIDDPSGYTYAGTKALAGNRTRAVRNAQSYKFYYLNLNFN